MSDFYNGPEEYRPIGMWGYFGYNILFAIPIVGLILTIVFAVSARNVNLKNYARAQFCWLIVYAIIMGIILASVGSMAGLAALFG